MAHDGGLGDFLLLSAAESRPPPNSCSIPREELRDPLFGAKFGCEHRALARNSGPPVRVKIKNAERTFQNIASMEARGDRIARRRTAGPIAPIFSDSSWACERVNY